ncbi:MAG: Ig-like domain-containing protein, partial [Gammaproteobacteria bacterium]
ADNAIDLNSISIIGAPANGALTINGDGTVTYTHDGSETLSDNFSYTISDISGAISNTATVNISVTALNDNPVAVDDVGNVNEGGAVTIDLAGNDIDLDNAIDLNSISIIGAPANGALAINGDGTVTYTHSGSETLSDTFTYTISDISGAISNTATVNITVSAVNDAPTAVVDADSVNEGGSVIIDLAGNDTDADNAIDLNSISIIGAPANGALIING